MIDANRFETIMAPAPAESPPKIAHPSDYAFICVGLIGGNLIGGNLIGSYAVTHDRVLLVGTSRVVAGVFGGP
jgi:hypothetical protein